jgi:Fic family protein
MEGLGFSLRAETVLDALTQDVLKSSEIEGEILDAAQVRSSVARRLGLDAVALVPADRSVEGVVDMMLDATQNYTAPLTADRLFGWHAGLFPTGYSGLRKIKVAGWRDDAKGPMQVVSGSVGKEHVHYQAPAASWLEYEMDRFLKWFASDDGLDGVLRAGLAHLWFVTLHPFDDGNGRIARALADMQLARTEATPQRFYSLSSQIRKERKEYYDILEQTQKSDLDVTQWLSWFLASLDRAIRETDFVLEAVLRKARFWEQQAAASLNSRQKLMVNKLLDGFEGKLTSSKWAKIAKCSQDSALRDIRELLHLGLLEKDAAGGRSTSYTLRA